jgi:hypothetical protein
MACASRRHGGSLHDGSRQLGHGGPRIVPFAPTATATVMSVATALRRQMLEWIAVRPREHAEVLELWRTSCPRLSIWEDACIDGLIDHELGTGKVILSGAGQVFLSTQELKQA